MEQLINMITNVLLEIEGYIAWIISILLLISRTNNRRKLKDMKEEMENMEVSREERRLIKIHRELERQEALEKTPIEEYKPDETIPFDLEPTKEEKEKQEELQNVMTLTKFVDTHLETYYKVMEALDKLYELKDKYDYPQRIKEAM